jgi:hypothetical protein
MGEHWDNWEQPEERSHAAKDAPPEERQQPEPKPQDQQSPEERRGET